MRKLLLLYYTQTNTKNVYKAFAFPQTTGGKEKPNIVVIRKVPQTSQHRTQNVKTHNRTTQKTKKMSNTDPTKKTVLLIYTVKSGKSLGSDRGKKIVHKKSKIHCHLRYGYFVMVNQILMTKVEFL